MSSYQLKQLAALRQAAAAAQALAKRVNAR